MPAITVSSSFGSGGSVVAEMVARSLGWELHNRAIPAEVAERLSLPLEAALMHDEAADTTLGRLLARFSIQLGPEGVGNIPTEVLVGEATFKEHSEAIIRRLAASTNSVIVGRAAAVVIGNSPQALHVRLDGSPDRRAVQASDALRISLDESRRRLAETDRARSLYVKHFYSRDWADARLYHLVIDSTEFSLDSCAALVVAAARARLG